jgi:hypothetical protein
MFNQLRRASGQRRISIAQRDQLVVAEFVQLFGQVQIQRDGQVLGKT